MLSYKITPYDYDVSTRFIVTWDGTTATVKKDITKEQLDGLIDRLIGLRDEIYPSGKPRKIIMHCEPAILGIFDGDK
jgi:hypothetical protein